MGWTDKIFLTEQRMSFGGHLEELRRRIIRSLLALLVGVVVALCFQNKLVSLVLEPHRKAIKRRNRKVAHQAFQDAYGGLSRAVKELSDASNGVCYALLSEVQRERRFEKRMANVVERIISEKGNVEGADSKAEALAIARKMRGAVLGIIRDELTKLDSKDSISVRLTRAVDRFKALMATHGRKLRGFSETWAESLEKLLPKVEKTVQEALKRAEPFAPGKKKKVLAKAEEISKDFDNALNRIEEGVTSVTEQKGQKIVALHYTEQFFTYLKIAVIVGLFLAQPFIIYQMWRFVGAGLYPREQKVAVAFIPFSLFLFCVGVVFGYYVLIPLGLGYLGSYGDPEMVKTVLSFSAYLTLFVSLTLLLGLVFQVPLLMFFLSRAGLVDPPTFGKIRKYAILGGICLGALLTPPDPFTQLMLAVPLVILYEIGIMVSRVAYRRREAAEATA